MRDVAVIGIGMTLSIIFTKNYKYSRRLARVEVNVLPFSLSFGNFGLARTGDRLKLRSGQRAESKGQSAKGEG